MLQTTQERYQISFFAIFSDSRIVNYSMYQVYLYTDTANRLGRLQTTCSYMFMPEENQGISIKSASCNCMYLYDIHIMLVQKYHEI